MVKIVYFMLCLYHHTFFKTKKKKVFMMVISSSLGSNYLQQSNNTTLNINFHKMHIKAHLDIKFSVISLCVTLIKDISIFNKKYEFHLLGVMYAQQPSQCMIDTETHVPSTKAHE